MIQILMIAPKYSEKMIEFERNTVDRKEQGYVIVQEI